MLLVQNFSACLISKWRSFILENSDEKVENKERTTDSRQRTQQFLYGLFNYNSYHSYKKNLERLEVSFLLLFIIGTIACFIPSKLGNTIITLVFICLILYSFLYTWIMMKSRRVRLESQEIMKKLQLEGNAIVKSWILYDGAYTDDDFVSIEIVFSGDKGIIGNLIHLIKGDQTTLPPTQEDMENLKNLLFNLYSNNQRNWLVYGTLNDDLVKLLEDNDIFVQNMDRKYRTKPSRLDFAVASGRATNALWKFPRTWNVYALGLDIEKYRDELIRKQEEIEKKRIRDTRNQIRKVESD